MTRLAIFATGTMLLSGCLAGTVGRPGGPQAIENATARAPRGIAVIAADSETRREAARLLAAPLAAECLAEPLGVARSLDECLAAARERGLDKVVTCRLIEYDPYDPARLVVNVTLDEAGGSLHTSAREAMALGRSTGGRSRRTRGPSTTVEIDLGAPAKSNGWIRAFATDAGLGESPDGLLEAEILLRDPARFFPFAAEQIAARIPAAEEKERQAPADGAKPVPVRRPSARVLGALGRRR
jgi:hypothetical protein